MLRWRRKKMRERGSGQLAAGFDTRTKKPYERNK